MQRLQTTGQMKRSVKCFRVDLALYEEALPHGWWMYSVWTPTGTLTMRTKNRKRRWSVKTMVGPDKRLIDAPWPIGRKEFETGECRGNKWLVPLNRTLDPSLP